MDTRWISALRAPSRARRSAEEDSRSEDLNPVVLHSAINSWRIWLTTGARRVPIDGRRARGSEARLKKILTGEPSGAVDFPSAMARQAIDEAMSELPTQHRQVVKLAYFGGLTNREIAQQLGLTLGGVRRRLSESLAIVGGYVERGKAVSRRAMHGLVAWLYWRPFGEVAQRAQAPSFEQAFQGGLVAALSLTAAALLVTHQAPSANVPDSHQSPRAAPVESAGSYLVQIQYSGPAVVVHPPSQPSTVAAAASPNLSAPSIPDHVRLPALPTVHLPALPLPVKTPSVVP
jgi:RNA polymerase sigma factor (sigma-70 family)